MRNDNPRPFAPLLLLFSALILAGRQQVAPTNATTANTPANNGKIAITSASDEARKEYLAGRDLQEKLRITDSMRISTRPSHSIRTSRSPSSIAPTSRRRRKSFSST